MSNDEHESSRVRGARPKWAPSPTATGGRVVDLDVSWLVPADLYAVDALLRLQVTALRCGHQLLVHGADGDLVELLEFVGLCEVMHVCSCRGTSVRCGE